jgi:hypothetical protein
MQVFCCTEPSFKRKQSGVGQLRPWSFNVLHARFRQFSQDAENKEITRKHRFELVLQYCNLSREGVLDILSE